MLNIDGVSENAAPGALMGHGRTLEAKEWGKLSGTQASSLSQSFEARVTRELGQHRSQE